MKTDNKLIFIPDILMVIKDLENDTKTITEISENTRITYSHVFALIKLAISKGWVMAEKVERKKYINLTNRGNMLLSITNNLLDMFGVTKENIIEFKVQSKRNKEIKNDVVVKEEITDEEIEILYNKEDTFLDEDENNENM